MCARTLTFFLMTLALSLSVSVSAAQDLGHNETGVDQQVLAWTRDRAAGLASDEIFSNGFEFGCEDLTLGVPVEQSFAAGLVRVYCLTVAAQDLIRFRMVEVSTSIEPLLELRNASGDLIDFGFGGSGTTLEYEFLNSGTYSLTATDQMRDEAGSFALSAIKLNSPTNALDLVHSAAIDGSFRLAEFDAYSFDAMASDSIRVRLVERAGSVAQQPQLELFDAAGNLLEINAGASAAQIEYVIPQSGTYYILASDQDQDDVGNYSISVNRLNAPLAEVLTYGVAVDGEFVTGEFDAYSFDAMASDSIRVRLVERAGSVAQQPQLELFDAAGNLLEINAGASAAQIEYVIPEAGTYYILASDQDQDDVGNYSISVNRLNAPLAEVLTYGVAVDGEFVTGEFDAYSFDAMASDSIRVRLVERAGSVAQHPQLELFDAAGNLLEINAGASAAQIEYAIPESGTYYILASDQDQDDVGAYTIEVMLL